MKGETIMRNQIKRTVQKKFKVTEEEAQKLDELASQRNMTFSEYIRECTLNNNTIPVVDKAPMILTHLASLSTLVNDLNTIEDKNDNTKQLIQEEIQALWQSLK